MRRAATAGVLATCLAVGPAAGGAAAREPSVFDGPTRAFLAAVDADGLGLLCVQHRGRVAILDTVAREHLDGMFGSARIDAAEPPAAFLELYLNAGRYVDRPIIRVREPNMRDFIGRRLDAATGQALARTGRLPPASLMDQRAWDVLLRAGRADQADMHRGGHVASLRAALADLAERREYRVPIDRLSLRYWRFLAEGALRVAPARGGEWLAFDELPAQAAAGPSSPARAWLALRDAWRRRDAPAANALIAQLGDLVSRAALEGEGATGCPSSRLRRLERLYNRTGRGAVLWAAFAAAAVWLIAAIVVGARWVRRAGLACLVLATAALTAAFLVRWAVSGQAWYLPPIMDQFEAMVGSALLGAVLAIVVELAWGRSYVALAAALYATVALAAAARMEGAIGAKHGILGSPVMAVHVTTIIVGHALVGMTFFISAAYLAVAAMRRAAGRRQDHPSAPPDLRPAGGGLSALGLIDRSNLLVAQLACWMVVLGTVLGAYWGDFAWGRWWGWDPKETWALITALVYVALLHVRFIVPLRWRGLLTACLCILGCAVMLFNWFAVNYLLKGMHSYA